MITGFTDFKSVNYYCQNGGVRAEIRQIEKEGV